MQGPAFKEAQERADQVVCRISTTWGVRMFAGETVVTGADHPGTDLEVLDSPAGFYLGYRTKDGAPYTRETKYMSRDDAFRLLQAFRH